MAKDAETWLLEAVDSILDQSFRDFEFLIIDDASTDDTASILRDYQTCDSRIKVFFNDSSSDCQLT